MSGERPDGTRHREVIVVGSGFGGCMAAWSLVGEGVDVLMLERGPWVDRGPRNWAPEGTITRTPYYREAGPLYRARTEGRGGEEVRACSCVGGPSVFYGGVSLRYREADFEPDPEIVTDSGARWPLTYDDLRPWYRKAERILSVAGRAGEDPTEPGREAGFSAAPDELSHVSRVVAEAARELGLHPFRLPLAINYGQSGEDRKTCIACETCDTFACAVEAKNDLATRVVPGLVKRGMELWPETAAVELHADDDGVAVACLDRRSGERRTVTADRLVLAAGALATPHLLLTSGLAEHSPAADAVGRYLVRHCSGIVFGAYPWLPRYEERFHKQIGIHDYYFGDPDGRGPPGKLGNIQQTQTPAMGTVRGEVGRLAGVMLTPLVRRATGLLVMAEDRPRRRNRVYPDPDELDELGLPRLVVEHGYDSRDLEARRFLADRAREIHRTAGAWATYFHDIDTFSHALGTVRMGEDPELHPLDPLGRLRGAENVHVTDGSALPTAAGVNPSLTIAANALRIGSAMARSRRGRAAPGAAER